MTLALAYTPRARDSVSLPARSQHGVPISYLDIYHADGLWCMPGELSTRVYHPYRHGYGKLMLTLTLNLTITIP